MEAVGRGDVKAVKALLQADGRTDLSDNDGNTARSWAETFKKQTFSMEKEADEMLKLLQPKNP